MVKYTPFTSFENFKQNGIKYALEEELINSGNILKYGFPLAVGGVTFLSIGYFSSAFLAGASLALSNHLMSKTKPAISYKKVCEQNKKAQKLLVNLLQ